MPGSSPPTPSDLRENMERAADVVGPLWLSFVFVLFYVLLAIAGVTHRTMFLQDRIKLPFPDVELPLLAFFWIGPVIVLLVHAYVLHHLIMLATKTRAYCLVAPSVDPTQDLLPQNIFVRLVAAPAAPDPRAAGIFATIVAWSTVVVIPVLTLIFFELQFLPFHSEATTWWARGAVILDIALLWWLWPLAYLPTIPRQRSKVWGGRRVIGMAGLSAAAIYLVMLVATFPGEFLDDVLPALPLHETLIGGRQEDGRHTLTVFPNRLFLEGIDLVDHKAYDSAVKAAMALPGYSLHGRHLEQAILTGAQLGRMDFVSAHLQGASLARARARGAWFDGADLTGAQLDQAELQGASFYQTTMIGATLAEAELQGSRMAGAVLRAAWLGKAKLDGASLASADLRRATLDEANLTGVNFKKAKLQGASLAGARFDGASLLDASLWKTDFRRIDAAKGAEAHSGKTESDVDCAGWPGADCHDAIHRVQTIIERLVPNDGQRARMLERLLKQFSPDTPEPWEPRSDAALADIVPVADNPTLVDLWVGIACIGKAAPFGISMLIDTYAEDKGWTRPRDAISMDIMVAKLANPAFCAAAPILTDDLKLGLADLSEAVAAQSRALEQSQKQ